MSRSFLVDSLIKKDSKPKLSSSPVNFLTQRHGYSSTFADYLFSTGRIPAELKSGCFRNLQSHITSSGNKFDSSSLQAQNVLFPAYYPMQNFNPNYCGVNLTSSESSEYKSKIFRPVPLPTSKKTNHIETDEPLPYKGKEYTFIHKRVTDSSNLLICSVTNNSSEFLKVHLIRVITVNVSICQWGTANIITHSETGKETGKTVFM